MRSALSPPRSCSERLLQDANFSLHIAQGYSPSQPSHCCRTGPAPSGSAANQLQIRRRTGSGLGGGHGVHRSCLGCQVMLEDRNIKKWACSHWTSARANLQLQHGLKTSFPFTVSVKTMWDEFPTCLSTCVHLFHVQMDRWRSSTCLSAQSRKHKDGKSQTWVKKEKTNVCMLIFLCFYTTERVKNKCGGCSTSFPGMSLSITLSELLDVRNYPATLPKRKSGAKRTTK